MPWMAAPSRTARTMSDAVVSQPNISHILIRYAVLLAMYALAILLVAGALIGTANADSALAGAQDTECAEGQDVFILWGQHVCISEETATFLRGLGLDVWPADTSVWYPQSARDGPMYSTTGSGGGMMMQQASTAMTEALSADATLGLSVGGAQDIANFRANIEHGYLPLATDITPEGLFYDYYFDTGSDHMCDELFCPAYSKAVARNPLSGDAEAWLSVGLDSGLKAADFARPDLNLVVVLDVSGSMSSTLDSYYYDDPGSRPEFESTTKMDAANRAVAGLTDMLGPDDRLGIVLFDNTAHVARPLLPMSGTDRDELKENIMRIYPDGGTYMEGGMRAGTGLFAGHEGHDRANRIIFLTDAMPNVGDTSPGGLLGMVEANADAGIHTTFVGMGLDFNTELVDHISKVRGANYYSVHSADEFNKRMVDEFDFMVTPLVFDLELSLESDDWAISRVYGSPDADRATGTILHVNTLFPSSSVDGEVRGGIILVRLEDRCIVDCTSPIMLRASYDTVDGASHVVESVVEPFTDESYDNDGIRKGVLLARYADLMQSWIVHQRAAVSSLTEYDKHFDDHGMLIMWEWPWLGHWERQSVPLHVSDHYVDAFSLFRPYFDAEAAAIGDDTLRQELDILAALIGHGG